MLDFNYKSSKLNNIYQIIIIIIIGNLYLLFFILFL